MIRIFGPRELIQRHFFGRTGCSTSLCSRRGLSFDPSVCGHIFVSRSRRPSPCAAHNLLKYGDCLANLRHFLRFPSHLSFLEFLDILDIPGRQVSLYLHPEMHLFAFLENSTLRRDCDLLRQTNLFDKMLSLYPGFSTQSDCSQSNNLSRRTARFIVVGFDFATILLSPSCSCILFTNVLVQPGRSRDS